MDRADAIARELRANRARKGASQAEVAAAIEANPSTVSAWENRAGISLEDSWKLADFYGISLDELAGRKRETA